MRRTRARGLVVVSSIAAALMGLLSSMLGDVARYDDGAFLADASDLAAIDPGKASLYRLSALTDLFGSYLLLLPAIVWLWHRFRSVDPLVADLAASCGVLFAGMGALGASVLVSARSPMIAAYAGASIAEQHAIASSYELMTDSVSGIWQVATATVGAAWFFAIGRLARRQWRGFGLFAMCFGAVAGLTALSRGVGIEFESSGPATPYFLPISVFAAWVALRCWREGHADFTAAAQ